MSAVEDMRQAVQNRDKYCRGKGYSRDITHPSGNWSESNPIHELFKQIREENYEELSPEIFKVFTGTSEGKEEQWVSRTNQIIKYIPSDMAIRLPGAGSAANYAYQERINLLYESGIIDWLKSRQDPMIVEIGGGFGGLAFALLSVLKNHARYVIVDLPESLTCAAIYLCRHLPDSQIEFVPNYRFDDWIDRLPDSVPLVINTLSLVEMNKAQMDFYASRIRRLIGGTGVFFEQNHDGRWLGMNDANLFLAGYFRYKRVINPATMLCTVNGQARLWSNAPLRFPTPEKCGCRRFDWFWVKTWIIGIFNRNIPPKCFAWMNRRFGKL